MLEKQGELVPGNARIRPHPDHARAGRLVLFDMDDTLFDHALTSQEALRALRRREPSLVRKPLAELWRAYSRLLEEAHPAVVAGEISVDESRILRFQRLIEFCGGTATRAKGRELSLQYRGLYRKLRRPVPGAHRLLERVHPRAIVGVVSNNRVAEQEEKVAFLQFGPLIDFMVISEGAGVAKPDPKIFEMALFRASVPPENSVMIGDSWENDVLGARAAGIRAVWFNRFGAPAPEPLEVPVVTSFRRPLEVERVLLGPR